MEHPAHPFGFAGKIVRFFIDSKLTPLIVTASVLLGVGAVVLLPREEEPQIVVPMIDVFVRAPGMSSKEVEERVTSPMEKLLWEIPGVDYVYSTSSPGMSMAIVRFYVGQNEEAAIVRLNQKMFANFDLIPPGVSQPLIKPRRIDDVPILALTLHGARYDHFTLRRIAAQLDDAITQVKNVSSTTLIGGLRRQVRVQLDAAKLSAYHIDPVRRRGCCAPPTSSSRRAVSGRITGNYLVETVDSSKMRTTWERWSSASTTASPCTCATCLRLWTARKNRASTCCLAPTSTPRSRAVTIAVAKRKGANAVWVVEDVLRKVALLKGRVIPRDVDVTITRNYGRTAEEKSNELLVHMAIAVVGVTLLIALVLGWRESGAVGIAIPVTLALTLATFYFLGYTLNRITLFALIFSIGILVDDAIVVVENIVRHVRLPANRARPFPEVATEAVEEIGNPMMLATLTVIAAVLPMAFVSGLMGPYMRPIPIGSSAAMVFSLAVAFVVTPWASYRILRRKLAKAAGHHEAEAEDWTTRLIGG